MGQRGVPLVEVAIEETIRTRTKMFGVAAILIRLGMNQAVQLNERPTNTEPGAVATGSERR